MHTFLPTRTTCTKEGCEKPAAASHSVHPLQDAKPKYNHEVSTATAIINYNAAPNDPHRPTSMPIYQSSTFMQPSASELQVYELCENPRRMVASVSSCKHVKMFQVLCEYGISEGLSLSLRNFRTGVRLHAIGQPDPLSPRNSSGRSPLTCFVLILAAFALHASARTDMAHECFTTGTPSRHNLSHEYARRDGGRARSICVHVGYGCTSEHDSPTEGWR
jgi:hypothetical protein